MWQVVGPFDSAASALTLMLPFLFSWFLWVQPSELASQFLNKACWAAVSSVIWNPAVCLAMGPTCSRWKRVLVCSKVSSDSDNLRVSEFFFPSMPRSHLRNIDLRNSSVLLEVTIVHGLWSYIGKYASPLRKHIQSPFLYNLSHVTCFRS